MFVSVIIPSYNHDLYLNKRIDSILNQTYQNFELILLDDLSPDQSIEILRSYENHPKVSHCIINEKNSGSTFFQWNKGIQLAKGDLIWIAESDDVAELNFLEMLVPEFTKNSNLTLAFCQSHRMNAQDVVTGCWKDHTDRFDKQIFSHDFTMSGYEYVKRFMTVINTVPNASAVLFKKQTYLDVGGANPELRWVGDWAIWSKIIAEGDLFFSHKKMNFFRYHETSVIARAIKEINYQAISDQTNKFRMDVGDYWQKKAINDARFKDLIKLNKKLQFKEMHRNSSDAIRKRKSQMIIPTSKMALKYCPTYLIPYYVIRLFFKVMYSYLIVAPLKPLIKK